MSNVRHWGESEDDLYVYIPKVNFSQIIDLALHSEGGQTSWAPQQQGALVGLPLDSVTCRAALLSQHARLGGQQPAPPQGPDYMQHEPKPPLRFVEKEYCQWSRGVGPLSLGRASSSDCRRALLQCAALELATHPPSLSATKSVLETMADAADYFLKQLTSTMRTIADREGSNRASGFPDLMMKTFTELGVTGLHEWYNDRVLGARQRAQIRCRQVEPCTAPEEVPELHFPASLEALGEGSLGPGYRMLHSLENADLLPRLSLHLELDLDQTSPNQPAGSS